jgi:hypothetical protein
MTGPHDIWRVSTLWQPLRFTTIMQCFHIWLHIRTVDVKLCVMQCIRFDIPPSILSLNGDQAHC